MLVGRRVRVWSHAKFAAGRWRWFVAESEADFQAGRFVADGEAASADEAAAQARAAARMDGAETAQLPKTWAQRRIAAARKSPGPKPIRTRRDLEQQRRREREAQQAALEAAAGVEVLAGQDLSTLSPSERAVLWEKIRQRSHELARDLEQQTSHIPRFAVGTVGKGKWFWAVVANINAHPHEHLGTGYAPARAAAVEAARQIAGEDAIEVEPAALRLRDLHQHLTRTRRRERADARTGNWTRASRPETILMDGQPIEVVKLTPRFIYVPRPTWRAERPGQMWRLDRQRMERDGELRHDGHWFTTVDHAARLRASGDARRRRPEPIMALGLELPCSEQDVHRAYRRRAMHLHPDHGGDPREFMRLHATYKAALELIAES
ncbi:MAG: J domain-containing protein [Thermomicrobiales bacterium]